MAFLGLYFPHFFKFMGGMQFAAGMVFLVASARIFYHCHYYGDTIAGALLGVAIAHTFFFLDVSLAVWFFVNGLPIDWE